MPNVRDRFRWACCAACFLGAFPTIAQSADSVAGQRELTSGVYFITQSWSQENAFRRPYHVSVPPSRGSKTEFPVFIHLHGNGGNAKAAMRGFMRSHEEMASRFVMVFAQGYQESWNIVSERSKADDLGFIESIVRKLATHKNVDANDFSIMGSSNGAALVNQLAIESQLPNIRNFISAVSPLNVWQHDGEQFKAKGDDNRYQEVGIPVTGRRLLNISGTEDRLVPYGGGPSRSIPAKRGKLAFVGAEQSTFLWAKQMGYQGEKLTKPTRTDGKLEFFSYLEGDVVHCKVAGAGHGAAREISEQMLLRFLDQ
ncbi:MAG: PHB depolymerase family esterase [Rubripirellula sp.]